MTIEHTVSIDFDPRLSFVKSVFDCRLPGVYNVASEYHHVQNSPGREIHK